MRLSEPADHGREGPGAVVAGDRDPAKVPAVFGHELEEGVFSRLAAARRDGGEGAPLEGAVRALHDRRVREAPVEDPGQERVPPLAPEALAVGGVTEEASPGDLRLEMQALGAGPELLEERVVEAIGPEFEGDGQELVAEAGAEAAVEGEAHGAEQVPDEPIRAQIHHGEDARSERLPHAEAHAQAGVEQHLVLGGHVRERLEVEPTSAEHLGHAPDLAKARVRRRQAPAAEAVAPHLVPGEAVHRETEKARVEPFFEARLEARELVPSQPSPRVEGALDAEGRRPHRRVAHEGSDVRAEAEPVEMRRVLGVGLPALLRAEERQEVLVGDRLDAREHVREVRRVADGGAERAAPHEDGRHAVPERLVERGVDLDLGVVVRVNVDEARRHPAPRRVDDGLAPGRGQRRLGHGHDAPRFEAEIPVGRRAPSAVEKEAVSDDRGGHRTLWVYHDGGGFPAVP